LGIAPDSAEVVSLCFGLLGLSTKILNRFALKQKYVTFMIFKVLMFYSKRFSEKLFSMDSPFIG